MALKGFTPASPSTKGAAVSVKIQNPPESPWPTLRKKHNPTERIPKGLLFLVGLLGAAWLVSKMRPTSNLGSLNKQQSGIGQVAQFKIEPGNDERVRAVIHSFLARVKTNAWFRSAVLSLLHNNHIDQKDSVATAVFLHHIVNDEFPNKPDPDGFESIVSPEDLMNRWIKSGNSGIASLSGADCDDKALFLAAMAHHAGIPAAVVLMDIDGDGSLDHAGVVMTLRGQQVYAECIVPGKELGWGPEVKGRTEVIRVP